MSRAQKERESEGERLVVWAGFTYIDLTENNIYYAANDNHGVKHIPGIPKIPLRKVGGWGRERRKR